MAAAVNTITTTITADALWGIVGNVIPVALTVTLFALGFYLIRTQLKRVSKAKGGM